MTALRHWLIFVGTMVAGALLAACVLALAGQAEGAAVTFRVALAVSAIGLAFAALMAGIIVWAKVRGGNRTGKPAPSLQGRIAPVSSRSTQREM